MIRWLFPRPEPGPSGCRCRAPAPGLGRRDHREPKSAGALGRQIPSRHTGWPGAWVWGSVSQGDASGAETIWGVTFLSVNRDVYLKRVKVNFKVNWMI